MKRAERLTFLVLTFIAVLSAVACGHQLKGKMAGVEPVQDVYLFENHSESLPVWKEHGAQDRTVIHIDGHIDIDWIPEPSIRDIISCRTADELRKRIVHLYEMKAGYSGTITIWNFIYAAARSGIIRKFYWVVPDGSFDRKNLLEDFRSHCAIKMHGVTPAELELLQLSGKIISGKVLGIPVTICELDALPQIDESVLLDIDVDYFSTNTAIDQTVLLDTARYPDDLLKRLAQKKLRTDLVTISCSSVGGFLPVRYHHFGAMLQARLKDPGSSGGREDFKQRDRVDPVHQDADLHQGDAVRGAGKIDEAIDLYRRYIAENPDSRYIAYARRRVATALADSGQDLIAINELKSFVSAYPDDPDALYYLGRLYKESGDLMKAVQELREAVKLDEYNGIYATELGSCLLGLGENDEALRWLQKGLELKPCNGNAHLNLAYYHYNKKDLEKAAESFKSALFVRPWDTNAHFMLGKIYYEQKRYMDAREEFAEVLRIAPDHKGARKGLAALGF